MATAAEMENSYQWMMRALGAYLDEEPSCRLSVVEVPDGFLVRMQRALHKLEPRLERFTREALRQQLDAMMHSPRSRGARRNHQGIWQHFPNGHQDFLRALGYELDQAQARNVVLDEVQDGIVLTYTHPKAEGGWETRMVMLGLGEIETILNEAFNRRKQSGVARQA